MESKVSYRRIYLSFSILVLCFTILISALGQKAVLAQQENAVTIEVFKDIFIKIPTEEFEKSGFLSCLSPSNCKVAENFRFSSTTVVFNLKKEKKEDKYDSYAQINLQYDVPNKRNLYKIEIDWYTLLSKHIGTSYFEYTKKEGKLILQQVAYKIRENSGNVKEVKREKFEEYLLKQIE